MKKRSRENCIYLSLSLRLEDNKGHEILVREDPFRLITMYCVFNGIYLPGGKKIRICWVKIPVTVKVKKKKN